MLDHNGGQLIQGAWFALKWSRSLFPPVIEAHKKIWKPFVASNQVSSPHVKSRTVESPINSISGNILAEKQDTRLKF